MGFSLFLQTLKLFGYILSFYLVILSVIPCCAFDDCPDDKTGTAQTGNHENGDDDCGTCSPFFNCEGCASVTISVDATYCTVVQIPVKKEYTDFISPLIPDVHYDFWQPPKLV